MFELHYSVDLNELNDDDDDCRHFTLVQAILKQFYLWGWPL